MDIAYGRGLQRPPSIMNRKISRLASHAIDVSDGVRLRSQAAVDHGEDAPTSQPPAGTEPGGEPLRSTPGEAEMRVHRFGVRQQAWGSTMSLG